MSNNDNRCANSEALARYERECSDNERRYEENCEMMFAELDDALAMIEDIYMKFELQNEAKEYIRDQL